MGELAMWQQRGDELGSRFVERFFEWVSYLYPELGEDTVEADESAAIEARTINATGFRYVGATTPETERSLAPRRG
jgi:hypothetical protein